MSSTPPDIDLTQLPRLPIDRLRSVFAAHCTGTPPSQRNLLIREIAWRVQEDRHGGLDAETRRLLRAAVRAAATRPGASDRPDESPPRERPASTRPRRSPSPATLRPSTRLVREWRGERHEITVGADGRTFHYQGQTYRSLTKLARVITGTHQSGPRFFGLSTRAGERAASKGKPGTRGAR